MAAHERRPYISWVPGFLLKANQANTKAKTYAINAQGGHDGNALQTTSLKGILLVMQLLLEEPMGLILESVLWPLKTGDGVSETEDTTVSLNLQNFRAPGGCWIRLVAG